MVKAHSGRIYLQKKREGVQEEEARLNQTMSQSVCLSADSSRSRGLWDIESRDVISRDANMSVGENHCMTGIV